MLPRKQSGTLHVCIHLAQQLNYFLLFSICRWVNEFAEHTKKVR
jgi:hypothetical protein